MPTAMPELPHFVERAGPWAVTLLHLADRQIGVLVGSHGQNTRPRDLMHLQVIDDSGWGKSPSTYLQTILKGWANAKPSPHAIDPMGLVGLFSTPVLRSLLTGHLIMVRREHPDFGNRSPEENVVEETAIRYQELTNWAEASSAWVLAQEYGIPVRTVHNRLRLARERGQLSKPGIGARR